MVLLTLARQESVQGRCRLRQSHVGTPGSETELGANEAKRMAKASRVVVSYVSFCLMYHLMIPVIQTSENRNCEP